MTLRTATFPVGAAVTDDHLADDLHGTFARLRPTEPVSWLPCLDAWVVTSRELAVEAMRDAASFTVDDPRFSTAQVLGPSMLSLDGPEHTRHRDPFAEAFRQTEVRRRFADDVEALAMQMVGRLAPSGRAELRRDLAGPLAVRVMASALELLDGDPATLLDWYDEIVAAVTMASTGQVHHDLARRAVGQLSSSVRSTIAVGSGLLSDATATLTVDEIVSNTGVMLFGGIETSEGMTTNAFAHLLGEPAAWRAVCADRSSITHAIEESLRLEPSVVRVDRFATREVELGGAAIGRGDFVIIALAAANRDPAVFDQPDRFDLTRHNAKHHVTFVHGPHACPGMHLARLETFAAIAAAIAHLPDLRLDPAAARPLPAGTVFRKPDRLDVVWGAGR